MDITWESFGTAAGLGLATAVFVMAIVKPLLDQILKNQEVRGLIINALAMAIAMALAYWWSGDPRVAVPLGLSGFMAATAEYEVVQNAIEASGRQLPKTFFTKG